MTPKSITQHYVALDVLRGLAACAVLVVHYRHFFMEEPGAILSEAQILQMPFQPWLASVYDHGHLAVQLFWLISGFVFAAAYVGRVGKGSDFAVARIARLYPLHWLTLFIVALLQLVSVQFTSGPQIYAHNSALDFMGQLFMASNWHGFPVSSFNFPIWSVSMEIVIYALFWITLPLINKHRAKAIIPIVIIAATCNWIVRDSGQLLFQCALFFFSGVFCQHLLQKLGHKYGAALGLGTMSAIFAVFSSGTLALLLWCAAIVMIFVTMDAGKMGRAASKLQWLGDSAYGIYLWHIPVQIIILLVLDASGTSKTLASQPWFFLMFLGFVLAIARLSFLYFEMPARQWVKEKLSVPHQATAMPA